MKEGEQRWALQQVNGSTLTLRGISNGFCLWYERVHKVCGTVRYVTWQSARTIDFSFPMITSKCTGMFCINKRVDKGRETRRGGGWSQRRGGSPAQSITQWHPMTFSWWRERGFTQYHLWCLRCFDVVILGFRCFNSVFLLQYAVLYGFEVILNCH